MSVLVDKCGPTCLGTPSRTQLCVGMTYYFDYIDVSVFVHLDTAL